MQHQLTTVCWCIRVLERFHHFWTTQNKLASQTTSQSVATAYDERVIRPTRTQCRQNQPDTNNDRGSDGTGRPCNRRGVLCACATLREHAWRDQLYGDRDSEWDQYKIVQVAQHRHKIRNQVDRTKRVGDDAGDEQLRMPRRLRVASGEIKNMRLRLEMTYPFLEFLEHNSVFGDGKQHSSESAARRQRAAIRTHELDAFDGDDDS
jgi:hypothetical protein